MIHIRGVFIIFLLFCITQTSCSSSISKRPSSRVQMGDSSVLAMNKPLPGADLKTAYMPLLEGRKVGIMANQTSIVGDSLTHLVDYLISEKVDVQFVFAPEHGFRGQVERGEAVHNETDAETGLPLHSLYGGNAKQDEIIQSIDVMIFDLQDVGARFYTYITSLHRVMELCAKHSKPLIVLDRPNPCGDQVDGPVRKSDQFKSTVSYHKIAMVHGLTIGELAQMINEEKWLENGRTCDLTVIPVANYTHDTPYELPVIPSPSLPNYLSVRLYASLCLFEATDVSVGRGTDWPFQVVGYPDTVFGNFSFIPGEKSGMVKHVEGKGETNYGLDLRRLDPAEQEFTLGYLLDFYQKMPDKKRFFTRPDFFDQLAGTDQLRKQIMAGLSEDQIKKSWQPDLEAYKVMRKKYLLYPDFE